MTNGALPPLWATSGCLRHSRELGYRRRQLLAKAAETESERPPGRSSKQSPGRTKREPAGDMSWEALSSPTSARAGRDLRSGSGLPHGRAAAAQNTRSDFKIRPCSPAVWGIPPWFLDIDLQPAWRALQSLFVVAVARRAIGASRSLARVYLLHQSLGSLL